MFPKINSNCKKKIVFRKNRTAKRVDIYIIYKMLITYNLRADSKSLNGNLSYRDSFWMRKKSILNKITTVCRRQKEVIISKDSQIKVGSKNSIFIFKQKVVVFITKITYLYANKILACTSIFLKMKKLEKSWITFQFLKNRVIIYSNFCQCNR